MPRLVLAVLATLFACEVAAAQPAQPPAKAAPSRYACPMKCEGDKTYAAEGKCAVCGMALKGVPAPAYSLTLASAGGPPKGNEPTLFNLGVLDAAGAPVRAFETMDGTKLHLYIVLRDLAGFTHLALDPHESGGFRFERTFAPGEYMIFADFTPAGGASQVVTTSLSVSGKPANPRAMGVDADRPKNADGCTVTLDGFKDAKVARDATLKFHITREGTGVEDLELFLGKPAHVILLSHNRKHLVHARAAEGAVKGPDVAFSVQFPEPGLYRAWLQFQRAGKVTTVPFNFEVAEAEKK